MVHGSRIKLTPIYTESKSKSKDNSDKANSYRIQGFESHGCLIRSRASHRVLHLHHESRNIRGVRWLQTGEVVLTAGFSGSKPSSS